MDDAVERLLGPYRVSARLVTLFASLALRAARVDPIVALRDE